ncbi:MAG TPA: lipoprotein-releasing system transmembrane subunit LolC [Nitrospiraceae bacterium]|nr:lipoprotein-releasing system transmembrane subunit LolC [Nitrospiraceae bacterium]
MKLPYEIFVSLRYLKTKKRYGTLSLYTVISLVGVMLVVIVSIVMLAGMTGFQNHFKDKILSAIPHVMVLQSTGISVKNQAALQQTIEKIPRVEATTPFTFNQGMLTANDRMQGVYVRGIDPRTEGKVTGVKKNIIEGDILDLRGTGRSRPGIVIGKELARRFGANIGDTVTLVNPIGEESALGMIPKMRKFELVGVFDAGMYDYNTSFVYTSLASAQKFFGMSGRITGIQVRVDDVYRADEIAASIIETIGFLYYTQTWMEINKNFFSALKLEKILMLMLVILFIVVASFNIIGTLTMLVMEKSREVAILKSMGATNGSIMKIFMFAGLIIGVGGTLVGSFAGYGLVTLLSEALPLPEDVYQLSHLPFSINGWDVLFISFTALGISFLATLYPSWKAAGEDAVEVLRYE